jgi:hypothetical protein
MPVYLRIVSRAAQRGAREDVDAIREADGAQHTERQHDRAPTRQNARCDRRGRLLDDQHFTHQQTRLLRAVVRIRVGTRERRESNRGKGNINETRRTRQRSRQDGKRITGERILKYKRGPKH